MAAPTDRTLIGVLKVTARNARFQQWQALLASRTKRHRAGEFLVQGVRPISQAVECGWPVRALLYPAGRSLSAWARQTLDRVPATPVEMSADLLAELAGKGEEVPELLAVVALPADDLGRIPARPDLLVVKRVARAEGDGWWLVGDNALVTDDSRAHGVADVIGRVVLRWWPRPGRVPGRSR